MCLEAKPHIGAAIGHSEAIVNFCGSSRRRSFRCSGVNLWFRANDKATIGQCHCPVFGMEYSSASITPCKISASKSRVVGKVLLVKELQGIAFRSFLNELVSRAYWHGTE